MVGDLLDEGNRLLRDDVVVVRAIARDRICPNQPVLLRHVEPAVRTKLERSRPVQPRCVAECRFAEADRNLRRASAGERKRERRVGPAVRDVQRGAM